MEGGERQHYGEADEYGRKRLGGIGQILGAELTRLTGVDTINQSLAYLMRAGAPDALDRMVAKSFGTMAVQEIADGRTGFMTALHDGKYATVPAGLCTEGKKRVDVAAFYDVQTYRPRIAKVLGNPMFFY